ncbi:hypothetical protein TI05_10435 [Achromatium sp. WMS3]|nr:hypothetical protein TI05_10435 [Achromatium sp. WMS3]
MDIAPKIIAATNVTLYDLEQHFQLKFNEQPDFFPEWQIELNITKEERYSLDDVKAAYMNLIKYPVMLENAVQITVVAPLLHLTKLLLPPFHLQTATSMTISSSDQEVKLEGRIDILVVKDQFWILVIESKRAELSIKVGLAQLLAYMLANPDRQRPCYGLITNGGSSLFVKLNFNDAPEYAISRVFDLLNPGNDLYQMVNILKYLRNLALSVI